MHREKCISWTHNKVGRDSETEGQSDEAMVKGQGIDGHKWLLGKEEISDLSTKGTIYNKEVLRRGRDTLNEEDWLANCICHLLIRQCVIK